ncbi:hypothetical protein [Thermorudis peleae]|uniref:hypothetical protein n=1 Tax=Thermorudis peleae TaxID=1382356 RepID=UPI0012E0B2FF|nr:hypothetical protein [Thermorudis peleae]
MVTRYLVRDATGQLVAVHCRRDTPTGKRLWWETPDGAPGLAGRPTTALPLYGIDQLGPSPFAILCEGEKATDALRQHGLPAVGTVTGASATPSDAALAPLRDRTVYLWPDHDPVGHDHMARIAARLHALGCSAIRQIRWPDAPPGGDAADYLAAGHTRADVEQLLATAAPWPLPDPTVEPNEPPVPPIPPTITADAADAGPADEHARASHATHLVRIGRTAELWHAPDGTAWATIPVNDHHEHWPIRSRHFREWLARQFYLQTGRAASAQSLQDATTILEADAKFTGAEHPVFVRIAEHDGAVYLDLADAHWRAVEITADGWRVVPAPPVKFRRARGMEPLPEPVPGGSLELLRPFLNVAATDWPLVLGWLVMAFAPRGPYPVLALGGEQGSGKTTTARVLRRLVDPNQADVRAEPRDTRDLAITAHNSWIICLDNASRFAQWLSDALCRLATGAGFAARELYSDNEETILVAQRPILITAVVDVVTAPDLLDRSVQVTCPVISDAEREPEAAFWSAFEAARPLILGALCDAVSRAVRTREQVTLSWLPRMADFAIWATAALGPESGFLERYQDNRAGAAGTALEFSPVSQAVLAFMERRVSWSGTAQCLLDALNADADEETQRTRARLRAWPKTAAGLSSELRRQSPALRASGLAVTWTRARDKRGTRTITLEWVRATSPDTTGTPGTASARQPAQSHSHSPAEAHTRPAWQTPWPSDASDAPTVISDAPTLTERQKHFAHQDKEIQLPLGVSDAPDAPLHDVSGVHHPAGVSTIPAASASSRTHEQDGRPRDPASTLTSAPSRTCEQDNRRLDPAFALHTAPSSTHGQPGAHPTSATATPQPLRPSDTSDAPPAISDAHAPGDRQKHFPHADADLPVASDASDASDARLQDFSGLQHQQVDTPSTPPAPGRGTPAPRTHDSSTGTFAHTARQLPSRSGDAVVASDYSALLNTSDTAVSYGQQRPFSTHDVAPARDAAPAHNRTLPGAPAQPAAGHAATPAHPPAAAAPPPDTPVPQPGTPAPATAAGAPRPDGPAAAHDTLEHRRPRRCVVCGVRYVVAFVPEKPEWVRFRCACQDGRWRWCRVHDRALWEH